jgi:hypothetical protein
MEILPMEERIFESYFMILLKEYGWERFLRGKRGI